MKQPDNGESEKARKMRDVWYKDLINAKKIVFIVCPNSKRVIDQKLKLIFVETIDFNI